MCSRRPPPWATSIRGFLRIRLWAGSMMFVRRLKYSVRSVTTSSGGSKPRSDSRKPAFARRGTVASAHVTAGLRQGGQGFVLEADVGKRLHAPHDDGGGGLAVADRGGDLRGSISNRKNDGAHDAGDVRIRGRVLHVRRSDRGGGWSRTFPSSRAAGWRGGPAARTSTARGTGPRGLAGATLAFFESAADFFDAALAGLLSAAPAEMGATTMPARVPHKRTAPRRPPAGRINADRTETGRTNAGRVNADRTNAGRTNN